MKSKKLDLYEIEKTGAIMMCPTKGTAENKFKQKDSKKFGCVVNKDISDAELGRKVREMFQQCD